MSNESKTIVVTSPQYTLLPFEKTKIYRSIGYGALAVLVYYLAARLEDVELVRFLLDELETVLNNLGITISMDWKPLIAGFAPVLVNFLRKWASENEYRIVPKK